MHEILAITEFEISQLKMWHKQKQTIFSRNKQLIYGKFIDIMIETYVEYQNINRLDHRLFYKWTVNGKYLSVITDPNGHRTKLIKVNQQICGC